MDGMTPPAAGRAAGNRGFSLVEVLIATLVLTVGLLSLAGVIAAAVKSVAGSSNRLIAREKAREAIESVHAARDTGRASWNDINNRSQDGIFEDGELPLWKAGEDGIVNTADDEAAGPDVQYRPGPEGEMIEVPLDGQFFREIRIEPVINPDGTTSLTLRQITVTIRYQTEAGMRTYSLRTFISSFS